MKTIVAALEQRFNNFENKICFEQILQQAVIITGIFNHDIRSKRVQVRMKT